MSGAPVPVLDGRTIAESTTGIVGGRKGMEMTDESEKSPKFSAHEAGRFGGRGGFDASDQSEPRVREPKRVELAEGARGGIWPQLHVRISVSEAAPAESLEHLVSAVEALTAAVGDLDISVEWARISATDEPEPNAE